MGQHRIRRPAIDFQPVGFLIKANLLARVRPDLTVGLVHRVAKRLQPRLQVVHSARLRLLKGLPWLHEITAAANSVGEMPDKQRVEI